MDPLAGWGLEASPALPVQVCQRDLNQGSGVLDIAGGTGLLSLALAQRGIQTTVVDPRRSCGCLPSRARKVARKTGAKEWSLGFCFSRGVEVGCCFFCRKDVQFSEQFGRGFSPSGSVDVEHPEQVDTANIQLLDN